MSQKKPGEKEVHIMEMTPERKERVTDGVTEVIHILEKHALDQFEAFAMLDIATKYLKDKYKIESATPVDLYDNGPVH